MIQLNKAVRAWGGSNFADVLKREFAEVDRAQLPLQQALASSSSVADVPVTLLVRGVDDLGGRLQVRAGILYQGVIGGCSCTDDPTPDRLIDEYCEVVLEIDKNSAATTVALLPD